MFIDEKGKLFGKINIVDATVVLLGVIAIGMTGYNLLNQKPVEEEEPVEPRKLVYTVLVAGVTPGVYEEVLTYLPGDQLMAGGVLLNGYVTDVYTTDHYTYVADSEGFVHSNKELGEMARCDMYFTVEALITDEITNLVGSQEVRVGKGHILKTENFEFVYGAITALHWEPAEEYTWEIVEEV